MSSIPTVSTSERHPTEDTRTGSQARWLLLAIAIGTTLAPLNSTMIAIALPDIQRAFNASVTETAWLVTLYLAGMAIGQPIGGRLGDLYGRRSVYLFGLIWFGIASAGCAFAPSLPILILFRTQQAFAGALSFPNGTAMIRDAVPVERRGSAFGSIALATGLAAASGPPIGGLLVHSFGWSAIFWANIPVVLAALVLSWRNLPRNQSRRENQKRFDLAGSSLFAGCLGALIVIPTLLKLHQPLLAIMMGFVGVAVGLAFVRWELRADSPVVDMRLFKQSQFAAACGSVSISNLVMYTTLLALPLYLENVRGHSVQTAGLTLAAISAFAAIWGPIGGRWTDRVGSRTPAIVGAAVLLLGTIGLTVSLLTTSLAPIIVSLALMGLGLGISGAPVQTRVVESVSINRTGSAAGVFSTSRYMGSVIGSSILAVLFAQSPELDEVGRFVFLFVGLTLAAIVGVLVNSRFAAHRNEATIAASV
jgi:EmrB/QacA subfamily drug resistance transporter